jgi:acyl-CoA synthetase (AMP-forming)/AMP-acid ligase II
LSGDPVAGGPPSPRPPGRNSPHDLDVWSLFDAAASAAPDRVAIDFGPQRLSYRQLRMDAVAVCEALSSRGVRPRERVVVLLPNSPFAVALYLAIAACGATVVPVNTRLAAPEVADLLDEARPCLVVVDDRLAACVDPSRAPAPVVRADTLLDVNGTSPAPRRRVDPPAVAIDPSDPCIVFYTSGTTGRPKGVIRTQQNVCWTALAAMWAQDFAYDTVLLAPLPLFHISGWETKILCCLLAGGRVVLTERFDADEVLGLAERHQVTHLFLVPTMTHDVVRHGNFAAHDLRSLRYWQSGTAPLPVEMREHVVRQLPQLQFRISYGTTEAGILSLLEHHERSRGQGCVGRVLPSVHVRIVDDEGRDLEAGVPGEIWCASPMATPGAFAGEGRPPTPAANEQNWLATGDIGHLDSDGFLFVSGRKKDVIISGGENVVAAEVEEVLKAHPAISDAAVIGTPDARWGERVTAFVTLLPGRSIDRDDIDRHCRTLLAGYKCPRRIEFVDALPKTAIGKVAKAVLREIAAARPDV